MCGSEVALFECKMCYEKRLLGDGPGISSYCAVCNSKVHSNPRRVDHKPRPVLLPRVHSHYNNSNEKRSLDIDKQKMELFAVVCIETSHYVAFVKCGVGAEAPWCFFDSMADRKGESSVTPIGGNSCSPLIPCPRSNSKRDTLKCRLEALGLYNFVRGLG